MPVNIISHNTSSSGKSNFDIEQLTCTAPCIDLSVPSAGYNNLFVWKAKVGIFSTYTSSQVWHSSINNRHCSIAVFLLQ